MSENKFNRQWNAVVLAGDRGVSDPVAVAAGVQGKAFAKLQNTTLLERIITVLTATPVINQIYLIGPEQKYLAANPRVNSFLEQQRDVRVLKPASGPSASALLGVTESNFYPTLIVTCDLALLNENVLMNYCKVMSEIDADFVACAIDYQSIHTKLPELKKTQYRFGQHTVCFANVFSVLSPRGLNAIDYWQTVEDSRKKPVQLIRKIDWFSLLRYKFGYLDLDQVVAKLSDKVDARLKIEQMSYPELAIDVDSAHDYQVMKKFLAK